jgi:hypothetical protein
MKTGITINFFLFLFFQKPQKLQEYLKNFLKFLRNLSQISSKQKPLLKFYTKI